MGVQLISIEGTKVKMEVTIELSRSMLTSEENIQQSLNETGCIATEAALKYLDTDGSAIEMAGSVMRTFMRTAQSLSNTLWGSRSSSPCLSTFWGRQNLLSTGARSKNHHHLHPIVCQTGILKTSLWSRTRRSTGSRRKSSPFSCSVLYSACERSRCQYH